ncbi:MAG: homoserine dehydrogenase [Oscillospiraceae bacterium]|jgi:homoserine dehydrogenase|nr:homoserine dehydrogenase [Oscillospiraceae bacterium]
MSTDKCAILGFGNIGAGTAELLRSNAARIAKSAGRTVELKYILDVRFPHNSEFSDLFTTDFGVIENDPEISVVIETIGGTRFAYDFTKRALLAGKSVVTSNKELVATHGHELLEIARTRNVNYLFEASVGGGIPILRPLTQCLAANEITEIFGILNGTTNYILTMMSDKGWSYEQALREAQKLGYAEADPSADVSGKDTCRKICILADLVFGKQFDPDKISVRGIEDLSGIYVPPGSKIKLVGRAARTADGRIAIYVAPHVIDKTNLLYTVDGVFNGIVVRGNAVGEVMFYGAGAGKMPTASAVVADVIDAVKHTHARKWVYWDDGDGEKLADPSELGKL